MVGVMIFRCPSPLSHLHPGLAKGSSNLIRMVHVVIYSVDRFLSISICFSWVHTSRKKNFNHFQVTVLNGIEQWGVFVVIDTVEVASSIHEKLYDIVKTV